MSVSKLTFEVFQSLCDYVSLKLVAFLPVPDNFLSVTVINTPDGVRGGNSYMYPNDIYQKAYLYINMSECPDMGRAIDAIAHELCHALHYRFEHYRASVNTMLSEDGKSTSGLLFNQACEASVDVLKPIMVFWLRDIIHDSKFVRYL